MIEVKVSELKKAVEGTHGGKAKFKEIVPVSETFQGKPVWEGIVHVFELKGHPKASLCYAWSSEIEGTKKRRFYTVLHIPPVASPLDAVRAAIVEEYRLKKEKTQRKEQH